MTRRKFLDLARFQDLENTSADAYATFLTAYVYPWQNKLIYVIENNVNAITYSVDGSVDNANWVRIVTDQAIAKNGSDYQTVTDAWIWLRVQVKSTAAGTHSTDFDVYIAVN